MTLDQERLRELLHYDPETGVFTWLVAPNRRIRVGQQAGTAWEGRGVSYIDIKIDGQRYRAHRLAWLYMTGEWPPDETDHRDCDGLDNRWPNLREATSTQNKANTRRRRDNTSGFKGVTFNKRDRRFQARIKAGDRERHLGCFDTAEEAYAAYCAAAKEHFGEFARVV
jgi:hypothetical protein